MTKILRSHAELHANHPACVTRSFPPRVKEDEHACSCCRSQRVLGLRVDIRYAPVAAASVCSSASAADSDDDNLPIAQFTKKHKKSAAPPDSDSEDDTLLTDLMKVKAQNL